MLFWKKNCENAVQSRSTNMPSRDEYNPIPPSDCFVAERPQTSECVSQAHSESSALASNPLQTTSNQFCDVAHYPQESVSTPPLPRHSAPFTSFTNEIPSTPQRSTVSCHTDPQTQLAQGNSSYFDFIISLV